MGTSRCGTIVGIENELKFYCPEEMTGQLSCSQISRMSAGETKFYIDFTFDWGNILHKYVILQK